MNSGVFLTGLDSLVALKSTRSRQRVTVVNHERL
jgi:hypothetical protein